MSEANIVGSQRASNSPRVAARSITFTVPGKPGHWERAGGKRGGRFNTSKTRAFEGAVGWWAREAMKGGAPMNGAVSLEVRAYYPIPKSWPKAKRARAEGEPFAGTPDASNVLKGVEDGMNGIAYHDDRQITRAGVCQRYSAEPRLVVTVTEIESAL